MMLIDEYFTKITKILEILPDIVHYKFDSNKINDLYYGIVKCTIKLENNLIFDLIEVINLENNPTQNKQKYKYQVRKKNALIFRYDNAKHYPDLPGFPHHKHLIDGNIISSEEPYLYDIILEIIEISKNI